MKASDEKLGMVVKGGIKGQPGNPLDAADEGVFCVRIIPGGAAAKDSRIQVREFVSKTDVNYFRQILFFCLLSDQSSLWPTIAIFYFFVPKRS